MTSSKSVMKVRNILILGVALLVSSCSTTRKSAQYVDVKPQVTSYPTVADLHVSSNRVSKTMTWKWNPFNTTSLAQKKVNLKADIIREAEADILVEPEYVQRTTWGNLGGGSLTISGYPAKLDNFRNATAEDIAAIKAAGILYGNNKSKDGNLFILLDTQDVNGVIIGKVPTSESSSTDKNETADASDDTSEMITSASEASGTTPAASETSVAKATPSSSKTAAGKSDYIGYDTVSKTRYLRTMAKEYYGNAELWPYIYEENRHKLGDPDRIRPGSSVKIPKLDKYGVNPNNPADIEKAKRLGREIYSRYGK